MMADTEFSFGDLVVNAWASKDNPNKVIMVLSAGTKKIRCLSRDGSRVTFENDKYLRLTKVGSLNFRRWDQELFKCKIDMEE